MAKKRKPRTVNHEDAKLAMANRVDAVFKWYDDNGIDDAVISRATGLYRSTIRRARLHMTDTKGITLVKIQAAKELIQKDLSQYESRKSNIHLKST